MKQIIYTILIHTKKITFYLRAFRIAGTSSSTFWFGISKVGSSWR